MLMRLNRLLIQLAALIVLMTTAGCKVVHYVPYEDDGSNVYRSYTGSEVVRGQIQESFESVLRLHNSVNYRTYTFDPDSLPLQSEVNRRGIEALAVDHFIDDHTTAGTGIILSNRNGRTTMLTASHTVSFPDTIWHYQKTESVLERDRVAAVSVKQNVTHFLFSDDGIITFELAVNDPRRDLALMMKRWHSEDNPNLVPLKIGPGNADDLEWTDMIYGVGFPKGIRMVTAAMVSNVAISSRRSFILDASFNRGFSGGALFAVRNDGAGLDWVGILSAAHAEQEYYLVPESIRDDDYDPRIEYEGPVYIRRESRINYGITYAVGLEQIKEFFDENRAEIERLRLSVPQIP
jgi:S1-C subfamily serine protease